MRAAAAASVQHAACRHGSTETGGRQITILICALQERQADNLEGKEMLTRAWAEAWSIAATDNDVLDSMSSNASSMFS